ncbi:hypothetical protein CYY_009342 [Polysphondylium violaceum]|uniref:Uncharacterized protein n=1 Tax=Polysphondylium violaceum TaxID=133409 RepID=A0A8J4UW86_9MYCE|nr:hypothetical protein CYY_009342 [Polysphondylium violaceum]
MPPHLKTLCFILWPGSPRGNDTLAVELEIVKIVFKKLLRPSVLPGGLKNLFLDDFNNCGTYLQEHSFKDPLNNLKSLSIYSKRTIQLINLYS